MRFGAASSIQRVTLPKEIGVAMAAAKTFTVEAWAYLENPEFGGIRGLFMDDYLKHPMGIEAANYGPIVTVGGIVASFPPRRAVHVALSVDVRTQSVYVDGDLVSLVTIGADPIAPANGPHGIGHYDTGDLRQASSWWDLRFWTIVRTQRQIREAIARGITGREPGLLAWFPLDQDARDYAVKTTAPLHGTIVGSARPQLALR